MKNRIGLCSLGIILGVAGSAFVRKPLADEAALLTIGILLFILSIQSRKIPLIVLALVSGVMIGAYRGYIEQVNLAGYERYIGQRVELSGKVSDDTTTSTKGDQRIKLTFVKINDTSLDGQAWLSTGSNTEIKRGDFVHAEGLLSGGFGSFQASMHRASLASVTKVKHGDTPRELRDWFAGGIKRTISEPESSLGIGYLVGQRNTLPQELDNNLRVLGLTHVVVASGFNLTILVRFARRGLAGISKYLTFIACSLMIIGFILVTGFSPSMSRAGIVTGLSLLAWYFGRRIHPLVLLPFAAAITLLINPSYIWGDIGWFLSFAAFGGVIILAPLLHHFFFGKKKPGAIRQVLIETTSAQFATMPIIAFIFAQYGPLAIPANLLILPLVSLAMALTFIAGLGGISGISELYILGKPAQGVLDYMTSTIDKLAALPASSSEVAFGLQALVISYVILVFACVFLWRRTKHDFRQDSIID